MKKVLKHTGASLVEVLIAAGLMGGLALVMANISENANRATMSAEMKFNAMYALDKIYRDLSDMNTCSTTFEGITLSQLQNHNFAEGPLIIDAVQNFPVKKTLPISATDLSACDSKSNSHVYRIPPYNEQENCKNILKRDFARKQVYFEHCKYHNNTAVCQGEVDNFFTDIIPADNVKTLYTANDIVMGTKLKMVEVLSFEEDTAVPPKFVNLTVRVTVDIRGRKENLEVIGASTKTKTFSFKAFLTETGAGRTIYSCQGEMSEEAAVEKACLALDGHYSAGKCHISGLVRNCRNVFAQVVKQTGGGTKAEYDSTGNFFNTGVLTGIDILIREPVGGDFLFSTLPYEIKSDGTLKDYTDSEGVPQTELDASKQGQDLRYFTASAQICNEGERVISAFGLCSLSPVLGKKHTFDILQSLPAQISRPGTATDEAKQNHWTLGCAVPYHILENENEGVNVTAQFSALCCENIIYED